jgi:hypothetical protein
MGDKTIREMKKETLEDFCIKFIERHFEDERTFNKSSVITAMKVSAKWQMERSYSEEEVLDILFTMSVVNPSNITEWFEQFNNKK